MDVFWCLYSVTMVGLSRLRSCTVLSRRRWQTVLLLLSDALASDAVATLSCTAGSMSECCAKLSNEV